MAAKSLRRKKPLGVGDRVRFPYGAGELEAVVVEDRGNLGVGGRQIVRVRILGREEPPVDPPPPANFEEGSFELPAVEMVVVRRARRPARRNAKPRATGFPTKPKRG